MAAAQLQIPQPQVEPHDLLPGHLGSGQCRVERVGEQPPRLLDMSLELEPPRQPRGDGEVGPASVQRTERAARRFVISELHLDLAQYGARRDARRIEGHELFGRRAGLGKPVLCHQARDERAVAAGIAGVAVGERGPCEPFGAHHRFRIAGFAPALQMQGAELREIERAGGITPHAPLVEGDVLRANRRLVAARRGTQAVAPPHRHEGDRPRREREARGQGHLNRPIRDHG